MTLNSKTRSQLVDELFAELRDQGFTISSNSPTTSSRSASTSRSPSPTAPEIGQVVTEEDVQQVAESDGRAVLEIPSGVIITPLAKERARDLDVELRQS